MVVVKGERSLILALGKQSSHSQHVGEAEGTRDNCTEGGHAGARPQPSPEGHRQPGGARGGAQAHFLAPLSSRDSFCEGVLSLGSAQRTVASFAMNSSNLFFSLHFPYCTVSWVHCFLLNTGYHCVLIFPAFLSGQLGGIYIISMTDKTA